MTFDELTERYGTHSSKWDGMKAFCGLDAADALPMWVADMDFHPPACVNAALQASVDHGIHGYFGNDSDYKAAIIWWLTNRHGWTPAPEAILTTHGLVNGFGMAIQAYSAPGDAVVLFTPVYHAFARTLKAAGREIVECELAIDEDGLYRMDFARYATQMTGREKIMVICSPQNPGGRVWSAEELRAAADFAVAHDLILISDEIHADLLMPGYSHTAMTVAAPDIMDRLVMMTAATKTFNIAGAHTGNVIIPDPALRATYQKVMQSLGISPNSLGIAMITAAYSPEGVAWLEELRSYLQANRDAFDAGLASIPGVKPMKLEGTYLAWVDFRGTGMDQAELRRRITDTAHIAVNEGPDFGTGGEGWVRFNLGTQRARVDDAVTRLQAAFADLQ